MIFSISLCYRSLPFPSKFSTTLSDFLTAKSRDSAGPSRVVCNMARWRPRAAQVVQRRILISVAAPRPQCALHYAARTLLTQLLRCRAEKAVVPLVHYTKTPAHLLVWCPILKPLRSVDTRHPPPCRALMLLKSLVQHALLTLVKPAILAHGLARGQWGRGGEEGGGGAKEQLPWRTRGDNGCLSVTESVCQSRGHCRSAVYS